MPRAPVIAAALLAGGLAAPAAQARLDCGTVEVVYANGRPAAGAQVTHHYVDPHTNRAPGDGESRDTNRDGRVCTERLLDGGFLEVHAPLALGGWCAAFEELPYRGARPTPGNPDGVTRVTLHMRWLRRSPWRGRVVSAQGHPLAGARVDVEHIFPDRTQCSEAPELGSMTAADGTFRIGRVPHGEVDLRVELEGYAKQVFRIRVPGPPRDLAIDRGAEWTGRLLDPDGVPIEFCSLRFHPKDLIDLHTNCSPAGFALHHVPPGDSKLYIRVGKLSTLGERSLMIHVRVGANEQRHDDIRWPAGLDVSGQVVDDAGTPMPGANIKVFSLDMEKQAAEGAIELIADERGRFAIHHLAAGAWRVMAGRNVLYEDASVTVEAGTKDLRLVLAAPR